jgi:hypothetical protein
MFNLCILNRPCLVSLARCARDKVSKLNHRLLLNRLFACFCLVSIFTFENDVGLVSGTVSKIDIANAKRLSRIGAIFIVSHLEQNQRHKLFVLGTDSLELKIER